MKYFEVYNDSNHLQINDTYMNLYMTRKIKVQNKSGRIQFSSGEIIGALGNGSNSVNGYCSNSLQYCDYYIEDFQNAYIYIFTTKPNLSSTNGMQIFNEEGTLIFDANQKQAKVIGVGTTNGVVVGNQIAIATGGLTINSDLTVNTAHSVSSYTIPESVTTTERVYKPYQETEFRMINGKYTPVTVTKYHYVNELVTTIKNVQYFDANVKRKTTYNKYINNLYINGGVISAKQFAHEYSDSGWKTIYSATRTQDNRSSWMEKTFPGGISTGVDKSGGVVSAYSFVVLDVSGL